MESTIVQYETKKDEISLDQDRILKSNNILVYFCLLYTSDAADE